jgi:hypothetical protein
LNLSVKIVPDRDVAISVLALQIIACKKIHKHGYPLKILLTINTLNLFYPPILVNLALMTARNALQKVPVSLALIIFIWTQLPKHVNYALTNVIIAL